VDIGKMLDKDFDAESVPAAEAGEYESLREFINTSVLSKKDVERESKAAYRFINGVIKTHTTMICNLSVDTLYRHKTNGEYKFKMPPMGSAVNLSAIRIDEPSRYLADIAMRVALGTSTACITDQNGKSWVWCQPQDPLTSADASTLLRASIVQNPICLALSHALHPVRYRMASKLVERSSIHILPVSPATARWRQTTESEYSPPEESDEWSADGLTAEIQSMEKPPISLVALGGVPSVGYVAKVVGADGNNLYYQLDDSNVPDPRIALSWEDLETMYQQPESFAMQMTARLGGIRRYDFDQYARRTRKIRETIHGKYVLGSCHQCPEGKLVSEVHDYITNCTKCDFVKCLLMEVSCPLKHFLITYAICHAIFNDEEYDLEDALSVVTIENYDTKEPLLKGCYDAMKTYMSDMAVDAANMFTPISFQEDSYLLSAEGSVAALRRLQR
jgi:hypothetical protein